MKKENQEENNEPTIQELRQEKIKEILTKIAQAKPLNETEEQLYAQVTREAQIQAQKEELHRQQGAYVEQQKEIQEEASQAKPEEILTPETKGIKFYSGPSKINQFITNFKINQTIAKGKKKGGTFILKGYRDTGIELVWSKTPVRYVKFVIFNEKGEPLEYISRVVKTKHRWKGTSIPVHIALEGVNENVDLFEGAEVELSAEYVNKALTLQWNAGLLTGLAMRDEEAQNLFTKVQPFLFIIILLLICVMAYMMYSMWQKLDVLDVNSLKAISEVAKQQLAQQATKVI